MAVDLALVTVRGFFSSIDLREASFSGERRFTGEVTIELRGSGGGVETIASLFFTASDWSFAPSASNLFFKSGARILLCSLKASASLSTFLSALQDMYVSSSDNLQCVLPRNR